ARSRNLKNPLNAALASQRSSSSRPVAGLSDDEDDRDGKQDPLATLKILTPCGCRAPGGRLRRRQPREAARQGREAEHAPARAVAVRYLHRVTRTMPLKQSRSVGKGLERLCRARFAGELGMRPLVAHCHLGRGKLY